ncbi:WD-40 repeat-containing protein [Histomonas meleagridis]|uniref:WD-40 repeat-containing protein n=1 Tax=Histomonas meleagridis TaxID=135588 RepID=UPI00355A61D2|nr:WD-40 repeat-containing protein [Histomonas meleagridis]KAH0800822.1 WD-40 repeat-containing protein [Histomonas meleagridis]
MNPDSTWRKKSKHYFSKCDDEQIEILKIDNFKTHVKIAVDYSFPLSFFVDNSGHCSLYSLGATFQDLGTTDLPLSPKSTSRLSEEATSILHFNNLIFHSNSKGVVQYEVNCADVARGQNLNDFMQMTYTEQKPPIDLGEPLATFYSCDVQIPSWPYGAHSVIERSKLKEKDFEKAEKIVKNYYAAHKEQFKAKFIHFYEHKLDDKYPVLPMSGPITSGARQMSFNYRNPTTFQSISDSQWFNWDISTHKLKANGSGDGFQLLCIDSSPIYKDVMALGSYGGNILLQDLRAKKTIKTFQSSFIHPISNIKFSSIIQPLLATSSDDFVIKLWDLRGACEKPFLELNGHTNEITSLQFSNHRCDFLFSSSIDSTIRIWNINNQCPPHHCLQTINPSNSPVMTLVSGCNRIDSFYFSCVDGSTGVCKLKEKFFEPVIPHRLDSSFGRECEKLLYFRQNQQLFTAIIQDVHGVLERKDDVTSSFPLLELTTNKNFDLSHGFSDTPIEEVISFFSYFLSSAVPNSLIQAPESSQLSDVKRFTLFAKVLSGIQKNDATILRSQKRNILAALDAFSREDVLNIVMVLASSSFEDALEVGNTYLHLLIRNKKLDKFLDVGYFLLYPTIFDDPKESFKVLSKIDHNARTRLRSNLNNGQKITQEITDYVAILSTAANDEENSFQTMFDTLKKHDSFLSMFLFRTYLDVCLYLQQWSNCFILATQTAKFVDGFPMKDIIYNWLDNEFDKRFSHNISSVLTSDSIDPASYIRAISEVIVISAYVQDSTEICTNTINSFLKIINDILKRLLEDGGSQKSLKLPPAKLALAIKASIDKYERAMPQQSKQNKLLSATMTLITNIINSSTITA